MRNLILLFAALGLATPAVAREGHQPRDMREGHPSRDAREARGLNRLREQDNAYRAMQQGRIRPLPEIRARINIPGADFIGVEFDGRIYRLKYMRGGEVIWIDVDAQTGQVVRRQ
jgi:hemin uptake protein HemP